MNDVTEKLEILTLFRQDSPLIFEHSLTPRVSNFFGGKLLEFLKKKLSLVLQLLKEHGVDIKFNRKFPLLDNFKHLEFPILKFWDLPLYKIFEFFEDFHPSLLQYFFIFQLYKLSGGSNKFQ